MGTKCVLVEVVPCFIRPDYWLLWQEWPSHLHAVIQNLRCPFPVVQNLTHSRQSWGLSGAAKDVILPNSNFCLRMISIVLLRNMGSALGLPGGYKNIWLAVLDLFSQMVVVWAACFQRSEADTCEKVESFLWDEVKKKVELLASRGHQWEGFNLYD